MVSQIPKFTLLLKCLLLSYSRKKNKKLKHVKLKLPNFLYIHVLKLGPVSLKQFCFTYVLNGCTEMKIWGEQCGVVVEHQTESRVSGFDPH